MGQLKTSYIDMSHGVTIDLTEAHPYWLLNRVHTNRFLGGRGKGYASQLLNTVLTDADAEGVSLLLSVDPDQGIDFDRLRNWYLRLGFRQFSPDDPRTLLRTAHPPTPERSTLMTALQLEGNDNYGNPRQAFADRLAAASDEGYLKMAEDRIWLSAYASNNARSDYHWQADAAYKEALRRGKPDLYNRAWKRAASTMQ